MFKYIFIFPIALLGMFGMALGQPTIVEGYVFETGNRGYLRDVIITVYSANNAIKAETGTNEEGFFSVELMPGEDYRIKASKSIFEDKSEQVAASDLEPGGKHFVKIGMKRKPGYLFDVTLADSYYDMKGIKRGIDSATIEIFNNTTEQEVLVLKKHPHPNFSYTFEQGNHYTVMIRKDGYFTKRMEAYVNIEGCILCFEGMGQVRPSDNLTEENTMGSLIANVELDKISLSRSIQIENIYYDYNKWDIRPDAAKELDKIISMMSDNPNLIIELGSHTDSRGRDGYNLELSEKRAKSAVAYIRNNGNIPPNRIHAKGYGETQIINRCANGVECSDAEHEQNRRTMVRVVGFTETNPYKNMSLRDIIYQEKLDRMGFEDFQSEVYTSEQMDADVAAEIERDLQRQEQRKLERQRALEKAREEIRQQAAKAARENEEVSATPQSATTQQEAPAEPQSGGESIPGTPPSPPKSLTDNSYAGAFGETTEGQNPESIIQAAAPLPKGYTGYMVEFFNSAIELSGEHSIFQQYSDVKMEHKASGEYAYLIGDFSNAQAARTYMENNLQSRFPTAKVIEYMNGKRTGK